uniref:Apolipoprotein B mRNA editing enzyme catalytic polypeptide-like 3Z2A isomer E n=1 Tax=Pteropus alecto TaxID=9402 RepID=A0A2R2Z4D2_PTEAL|nr:apolipoprotein B mRNA editing enzyme catalytic polypeptide-like 3Z2A isomer E [Pteropus alecto]
MHLQVWRKVTEAWREGYTLKPWSRNPMERLYHDYFYFHFYNLPTPKHRNGCYICYQVEGTKKHSRMPLLRGVFENQESLDMMLSPGEKYRVTWYISWSPCFACVDEVIKFLREHTNVELIIFAARLYHSDILQYRQGLRKLHDAGVHVAIMSYYEFKHCLNDFVFHQGRSFCPWNDLNKNSKNLSNTLEDILRNQED